MTIIFPKQLDKFQNINIIQFVKNLIDQ